MAVKWSRYGDRKGTSATINGRRYTIHGTHPVLGEPRFYLYLWLDNLGTDCVGEYESLTTARAAAEARHA